MMARAGQLDFFRGKRDPPQQGGDEHAAQGVFAQAPVPRRQGVAGGESRLQDEPQRAHRLGHHEGRRDALARDVADREINLVPAHRLHVVEVAADIAGGPIDRGEIHRGGPGQRAGEKAVLDFAGEGELAIDPLLLAEPLEAAELFNRGRGEIGIRLKGLQVALLEGGLAQRIQYLQHADLGLALAQGRAEDRVGLEAGVAVGIRIKTWVVIGIGDQHALAVLHHPAGDSLAGRHHDPPVADFAVVGPASHREHQLPLRVAQEEGTGLGGHDPLGHVENRSEQFVKFSNGIDRGADLDEAFVKLQRALQWFGNIRHRRLILKASGANCQCWMHAGVNNRAICKKKRGVAGWAGILS
ncbi:MAG: hypothetical protein QM796_06335 [Chthoniobacteraceae bacterium]